MLHICNKQFRFYVSFCANLYTILLPSVLVCPDPTRYMRKLDNTQLIHRSEKTEKFALEKPKRKRDKNFIKIFY